MNRRALLAASSGVPLLFLVLLWECCGIRGRSTAATTPGPSLDSCQAYSCSATIPRPTPTPEYPVQCPTPTPEPLWVEAVSSPTQHLTQTILVYLGNGEAVTVTCESGTFHQQGLFSAYGTPARVAIDLLPETEHHLKVSGKVRIISDHNGCIYGGYTLYTTHDRHGKPLWIEQRPLVPALWLPLMLKAQP